MSLNYPRWHKLFLFGLGLSFGAAFCMKWIETDFGNKFTIIGLELFYSKTRLLAVLTGMDAHERILLDYHLHFDFLFMAGIYPAITALCMIAMEKLRAINWRKFLYTLALVQLIAWGCDITENLYLLKWLKHPQIGDDFGFYHLIVATKWIIALAGALVAIITIVVKRKNTRIPGK